MIRWLTIAAALLAVEGAAAAEVIAIEGATVHSEPGVVLEGATVVLRDGVIAAVGVDAPVPADARRIEGRGKVVTAGLIEAYGTLGLVEVGAVEQTVEGLFGAAPSRDPSGIRAAYRISDGYNPASVAIPIARASGITSAVAVPRGGLIAGTSAWMALIDTVDPARAAIRATAAMHTALGETALGSADGSRGIAVERLRELLDDAREYGKNRRGYQRNQTREFAAARLDLEALQPVLAGELPLVITAHRASDILAALRLARELKLRVAIAGATEAWRVAEQLAAASVPVLIEPIANLPASFDRVHVRDDQPKLLRDAGVEVIISTLGDAAHVRTLRQWCGIAVRDGMSWDDALAAVTTAPARLYGEPERGRIAAGAPADVVVWSGDPFELSTRAEHVFIGGDEQSLTTRQTRLLDRYREL